MEYQENVTAAYSLTEKMHSRHIVNIPNQSSLNLFAFCTQTPRRDNELHIIEYVEKKPNIYARAIYQYRGQILKCFPHFKRDDYLFTSVYDETTRKHKLNLVKLTLEPTPQTKTAPKPAKRDFEVVNEIDLASSAVVSLNPLTATPEKVVVVEESRIFTYDSEKLAVETEYNVRSKVGRFRAGMLDPHHNNLVAVANDKTVGIIDLREGKEKTDKFLIEGAHDLGICDLDFNPNRQYFLMTSGEDSYVKFWDIRKKDLPIKVLNDFTNTVLCARFNKFHDQLILCSGNDGSLTLYRAISTSSAPILNPALISGGDAGQGKREEDGPVKTFDEHDDSVYSISWSDQNAWIFASLSYSGHVIVNPVPSKEKYRILL